MLTAGGVSYGYDVFGGVRSQSGSGDTDFKFTGEQLDADSGAGAEVVHYPSLKAGA